MYHLISIAIIVTSQDVTQYIDTFSDELQSIMCENIRLGGDKCDNKIYGVQDFVNSFQAYFDNGNEDASIVAKSIINRLDSKLNLRASFIQDMASVLQSNCLKDFDKSDNEYLLSFDSLYFSGNDDREEHLPNDMAYNEAQNREVSVSASTYKLPNDVSYKNKHVRRDAQISELLDRTMVDLYDTYCKSDVGNDEYCTMYFGTINGVFRRFPGAQNSKTDGEYNDYDPRFRPWYVSAASGGGKDVVILVDISVYMDGTLLNLARKAAKAMLKTLGQSSFVNVVAFGRGIILSCFGETLVAATKRNVEELSTFLDKLSIDSCPTWSCEYDIDFKKAFNKAFDILGKEENIINCRTSILLFTQGDYDTPDSGEPLLSDYDPSDVISKRNTNDINAVVFSYTLGEVDVDRESEIPRRVAKKTNGVYTNIKNANDNLITKLSSYYLYYSFGNERKVVTTSPYLDFDTKNIMITMAMPVYLNDTYFVGVVGTDIPLSFLADAIGDIIIGPNSYSFVINEASEILLHPLVGDPTQLFKSDAYAAISVTDVEPDEFTQNILQAMLRREYGEINVETEIKQPAGNVEYNGYVHEEMNVLYIYSGVGPSSLSVAVAIYTEADINAPFVPSFGMKRSLSNVTNCNENGNIIDTYECLSPFNLYHRLDLMLQFKCDVSWDDKAQILNGAEMNVNDEYYNEFYADMIYSVKYPIFYLQSGLYENELDALHTDPSCDNLVELHQLTNRLNDNITSNKLPFGGVRNEISSSILNTIYSLTSLHKFWQDAFLSDNSPFVSMFFGQYQGLHISYPGKIFKSTYNPLIRPWYQRARSYPDLFVWTTPYKHAVTEKLVTGASTVVSSPYFDYPFGVLGFNIEYSQFVIDWKNAMNDICNKENDQYCFLIDSSGFFLYYDGMEYDVTHDDISRKFLGDLEPTLMQSLLEREFFIKDTNANFKIDSLDISYIVNEDIYFNNITDFADIATSFEYNSGTYTVHSIYKTNLYLIFVSNYDLGKNIYPRDCPLNELCSSVKSPGCIKEEEIEKIFIYKHIVESSTKCKILTLDVCTEPETAPSVDQQAALKCRSSNIESEVCVREDNKQTDICSANCDSANIISVFYFNIFVFSVFAIFFVM